MVIKGKKRKYYKDEPRETMNRRKAKIRLIDGLRAPRIFVVGYPKSGNTYLVRLLNDVFGYETNENLVGQQLTNNEPTFKYHFPIKENENIHEASWCSPPKSYAKICGRLLEHDKKIYMVRNPYSVMVSAVFWYQPFTDMFKPFANSFKIDKWEKVSCTMQELFCLTEIFLIVL